MLFLRSAALFLLLSESGKSKEELFEGDFLAVVHGVSLDVFYYELDVFGLVKFHYFNCIVYLLVKDKWTIDLGQEMVSNNSG